MSAHFRCPVSVTAKAHPEHPAVIMPDSVLSYLELDRRLRAAVFEFTRLGVKKADRIAFAAESSLDCLIAMLAAWRMGGVVLPFSPRLPERIIADVVKKTGCRIMDVLAFTNILGAEGATDIFDSDEITFDQPATILLTSGSSGTPKAVLHSYGNHHFNALGANQNLPVAFGDRWVLSLPLCHVAGLGILFRVFLGGAAVVLMGKGENIAETIATQKVTHVSMVPTQLHRVLQKTADVAKLTSVKVILLGGGPTPGGLLEKAAECHLLVYITYGMTEMASQVATGTQQAPFEAKILAHRELKISAENEILVRGKTLFAGYLTQSGIDHAMTKEGWFATGDFGALDAVGRLTVLGRKDTMFISGGENIYPEEIEMVLVGLAAVERAVVVSCEDSEFGARPVAFLKWNTREHMDLLEVNRHLRNCLPGFKVPVRFYEWPENMDDNSFKVQRRKLRELMTVQGVRFKQLL